MSAMETQQANVSPRAGRHLTGLPGQSRWKGKLFAQQMTSLRCSEVHSTLSYAGFNAEQLKPVIEIALCFLYNSVGSETMKTFFYTPSTVFLYRLIISEDKLLLIFVSYKMLLLL